MSSSSQDASIPAQRKAVEKYAAEHGYRIVREYLDEAISGDATEKRLGFQRMVADASRAEWSVILCWDQDRFGRFDPIEGGYWIKPLRDAKVRLETVAQGLIDWTDFAGRIVWSVQQEAKHAYLRDLSRNVLRGHIENALQGGRRPGVAPFGYDKVGDDLVPNDDAEKVRGIFAGVLSGRSLRAMARELGTTARGVKWSAVAVRSIVRNPVYRGAYVWGRRKTGKYHRYVGGRIEKADAPCDGEAVVMEDHHEPIVTADVWHAAQARLSENKTATAPNATFAFSGLVVCGHCGGKMHGQVMWGHRYYQCVNRGKGCRYYSVRESVLTPLVLARLGELFGTPEKRRMIRAEYQARLAQERQSVDLGAERKRLASLDRKLAAAAERLFEIDPELLPVAQTQARRLKDERDVVAARIAEAEDADRKQATAVGVGLSEIEAAAGQLAEMRDAAAPSQRRFFRELLAALEIRWETGGTPKLARHHVSAIRLQLRHDMLGGL